LHPLLLDLLLPPLLPVDLLQRILLQRRLDGPLELERSLIGYLLIVTLALYVVVVNVLEEATLEVVHLLQAIARLQALLGLHL